MYELNISYIDKDSQAHTCLLKCLNKKLGNLVLGSMTLPLLNTSSKRRSMTSNETSKTYSVRLSKLQSNYS